LPKLPVVNDREAIRALERAGFVVERQNASHVILVDYERDLEVAVSVHAGRDLPTGPYAASSGTPG
jgi:predicted RNA binding protein YcfA (HicA-like mRNA interferase family)